MQGNRFFPLLKVVSYFVLLTMLAGAGYTFVISLVHWSGISV